MATVKVRLDGLQRLKSSLSNGSITKPVLTAMADLDEEIIAKGWSGVQPPRSSDGDIPAIDTGELAGSIQQEWNGNHEVMVFTEVAHGLYLEYGTRHMAARPWMEPAAEEVRQEVSKIESITHDTIIKVVGYM